MKTYEKVYNLVKKIPKGKIATYGQIGQILNLNPRVVGWALNRLARNVIARRLKKPTKQSPNVMRNEIASVASLPRNDSVIPWHRIINSKGEISTNKLINIPLGLQKSLLEKEGIKFDKNEKVDLKKYLWRFLFLSTFYVC